MTQFVYNNSKYSNIDQAFQKFLSKYVANLNNDSVSNFSKKKHLQQTKQKHCETIEQI